MTGEASGVSSSLEITIDAESNVYLDGELVERAQLGDAIKATKANLGDKKAQALITADVLTPHGEVVKLIDLVRKNGISEFALNVEVPSGSAR